MKDDLSALASLFEPLVSPQRLIRETSICEVVYGFGDASGSGFGSSWTKMNNNMGIHFRIGVWNEVASNRSSNFRELRNLVEYWKSLEQTES